MATLHELIEESSVRSVRGDVTTEVAGIAYDSRSVQPGQLFVCIRGFSTDGHEYAAQALARGACGLVCEAASTVPLPGDAPVVVQVDDTRKALADLSTAFYGHPSRELTLVGVTGTNGKTTTAALVSRVFEEAGIPAASVGTLGVWTRDGRRKLPRTTPEASDLQQILRELVDGGIRAVVLEVSSHALSLHRVRGCLFDVGVFTNLTRDHLDFHQTLEEYLTAKAMLFTDYAHLSGRHKAFAGVVNVDDPSGPQLVELCPAPTLTYGIETDANLRAEGVRIARNGAAFVARFDSTHLAVNMRLTGRFNVYNALAAAGVGVVTGMDPELIRQALESMSPPPGRLEPIEEGQPFGVTVDYAHTPEGLRNVIATVREFTSGRLIIVFGCGGDRDRTKRPQMGALASAMSDVCIVTSDNPRSEDPEAIIADILEGVEDRERCRVVVDRKQAIEEAVRLAEPTDFVLIAGKGHETEQVLKGRTLHFDDREVARTALRGRYGG